MWPSTLSGRLLIVALVGRYPANQLIRRGPIPHRTRLSAPPHVGLCAYAVLAAVSGCCPPVRGRLSTRYSPVRHSVTEASSPEGFHLSASFDLHVLGTPPAFILSQDQTLIKSVVLPSFSFPPLPASTFLGKGLPVNRLAYCFRSHLYNACTSSVLNAALPQGAWRSNL